MPDNELKGRFGGAFWDDLRAPAVAINPPGAVSDPGRDTATGWLLFDTTATEVLYITYQMPHGYLEGSDIHFHVHWHKSTSATGTVAWRMRYRYANIGATWSAYSAAETVTTPLISDLNTAEHHAMTVFTPISIPGAKISMCLFIELARVGSDDSYGADAVLTDADCHIQVNQGGSASLYSKYTSGLELQP